MHLQRSPPRRGCDTVNFKQSKSGLNSEFSFYLTGCHTEVKEPNLPYYLPLVRGGIVGLIIFPRLFTLCEMWIALLRNWTRISVSISYKESTLLLYFDPSTRPKNTIPRWYTGRKWHIPMASNRKRSRGRIKAYDMGQGEGLIVPLQWCTGRE